MSNLKNKFIRTKNSITLVINDCMYNIASDHIAFTKIAQLLNHKTIKWGKIKGLVDAKQALINYIGENISIENGIFKYQNKKTKAMVELKTSLTERILDAMKNEEKSDHLINFLDNLCANLLKSAINELFLFLETQKLPITQDGCFLAYKKVKKDYTDCYSGTFDNSIGNEVKMSRRKVDTDRENTCSYGLHFCSKNYLRSMNGDRIVVVKINPKDVVAIPNDYNNSKGRACKYIVVGEIRNAEEDISEFLGYKVRRKAQKVIPEFSNIKEALKTLKNRKIGDCFKITNSRYPESRIFKFKYGIRNVDVEEV